MEGVASGETKWPLKSELPPGGLLFLIIHHNKGARETLWHPDSEEEAIGSRSIPLKAKSDKGCRNEQRGLPKGRSPGLEYKQLIDRKDIRKWRRATTGPRKNTKTSGIRNELDSRLVSKDTGWITETQKRNSGASDARRKQSFNRPARRQ